LDICVEPDLFTKSCRRRRRAEKANRALIETPGERRAALSRLTAREHLRFLLRSDVDHDVPMAQAVV